MRLRATQRVHASHRRSARINDIVFTPMNLLPEDQKELAFNVRELLTFSIKFSSNMRTLLDCYVFQLSPSPEQAEELLKSLQDIDQVYGSLYPEHKGVPLTEI